MANVKFSDFAVRTTVPTVDYIVGYQGAANIQIAPTDFLGDYLPLAGGDMVGPTTHGDSVHSYWGNSNDIDIFHDGGNSYIDDRGTGRLSIRASSSMWLRTYANEDYIKMTEGGSVDLYYDNSLKFSTYAIGAGITGNLYFTSGNKIHFDNGVSNDYYIEKSGTALTFNTGGTYTFNSGNATFVGTVLIDDVLNYTGLEIKGNGASRPSIQWSNATQGDLGSIYGTESNALVITSGAGNTTTLTLDSSNDATFSGNIALASAKYITTTVPSGGGAWFAISHTGNESWTFDAQNGTGSDDYLSVGISGGTRAMSWHEDGKVGMGTTAPFSTLSINSNGVPIFTANDMAETGLTIHNGATGTAIQIGTYDAGSYNYIQSGYINSASTARELRFYNGNISSLKLSTTGGATFYGGIIANGGITVDGLFIDNNTIAHSGGNITLDAGDEIIIDATNTLSFVTTAVERMIITQTGLNKINSSGTTNHETYYKTGTYYKLSTGSTTAMTIVKVGHTHAVNYTVIAKVDTSNVGTLVGNTSTAYGSNGGIIVDSEAYAGVITDIAVTYDNSYYGLNVAVTYTGATAPHIWMAVKGQSSEDFVQQ